MPSSVCRVCLASDKIRKIRSIEDSLLEIYEKLAKTKLNSEDGQPYMLCYICYWRLQKCKSFSEMAHRSETILKEVSQESIAALNIKLIDNLSIKPVNAISVVGYSDDTKNIKFYKNTVIKTQNTSKAVKEEIKVKEETNTNSEYMHIEALSNSDDDKTESIKKMNYTNSTKSGFCCAVCQINVETKEQLVIHHLKIHTIEAHKKRCAENRKQRKAPNAVRKTAKSRKINKSLIHYICDICKRVFKLKKDLKYHIIFTHEGRKDFLCHVCGKAFARRHSLKLHKRIHTGEKPHACKFCNLKFTTRHGLTIHIRTHTGEKPYVCECCSKAFATMQPLIKHHRTHTGEKPFPCPSCDKSFHSMPGLKEHAKSHSHQKPYACDICEKAYKSRHGLVIHKRDHTGIRPYNCDLCSKSFKVRYRLKEHLEIIHKNDKLRKKLLSKNKFGLKRLFTFEQ